MDTFAAAAMGVTAGVAVRGVAVMGAGAALGATREVFFRRGGMVVVLKDLMSELPVYIGFHHGKPQSTPTCSDCKSLMENP
jgi:uncharacterized phosphosugar-binding protein